MWDAVYGGLEPQPRHYNITWAQPYCYHTKIHPHLHRHNRVRAMVQAYVGQKLGANTLYIHMIWMWDAVYGGLEPQP